MRKLALFLTLASGMAHASCDLPESFWDWPRSGDSVLALKEIRPCIDAYLATPGSSLVIRHGKQDENILHADELRAWLVSLGISPSRIRDVADDGTALSIENH